MADQPPSSDFWSIVRRRDYWPGFKRECKVNISAWFLEESCFISNRQNILNTTMVFNKKEKSFCENFTFFARPFCFIFALCSLGKNAEKIMRKLREKILRKFHNKNNAKSSRKKWWENFTKNNAKREHMYCVDGQARNLKRYLIKSNSLHQVKEEKLFIFIIKLQILSYQSSFFWEINCCSYRTHGFHKIFTFREDIFAFSRNFRISRKYFFGEKFSSLVTLL